MVNPFERRPGDRLWIIGQPPIRQFQDVVHLILRTLLLTTSGFCW